MTDGGRYTSSGRRLLVALLSKTTAREVARDCRCTRVAITLLATGKTKMPALPIALALGAKHSIDPCAWLDACLDCTQSTTVRAKVSPLTRHERRLHSHDAGEPGDNATPRHTSAA